MLIGSSYLTGIDLGRCSEGRKGKETEETRECMCVRAYQYISMYVR